MKRVAMAAMVLVPALAQADAVDQVLAEVSAQRIEANIRKLVSFGTRNSLSDTESPTRGIGAARRWILEELKRCGGDRLQVSFDDHLVETGPRVPKPTHFVNVVAMLPGTQPESRARTYVVSGHYDSMPSSPVDGEKDAPGANDDASGTAVSMELACAMSKYRFDATLVFMAVAGEEQGLLGATGYAKAARARGDDIAGMFTGRRLAAPAPGCARPRRRAVRRPAGVCRLQVRGAGGASEWRGAGDVGVGARCAFAGGARESQTRERHHASLEGECRTGCRRLPDRLA